MQTAHNTGICICNYIIYLRKMKIRLVLDLHKLSHDLEQILHVSSDQPLHLITAHACQSLEMPLRLGAAHTPRWVVDWCDGMGGMVR